MAIAAPASAQDPAAGDAPAPVAGEPSAETAPAESARQVAERVHHEGRYPSDVTPLLPDRGGTGGGGEGDEMEGAGRGARGETTLGDRASGDRGTGDAQGSEVLRQILEWLGSFGQLFGGPLAYVMLAIGLALLALLVAYLVARARFGTGAATIEARPTSQEGAIDPMLVGPALSADELAAQQRWGEAIHALFLDALGRIGGAEGSQRGRTARELVARARARAAAPAQGGAELGELLDLTELVWFGGRPATEDQYQRARTLAASVPEAPRAADARDPDREEAA